MKKSENEICENLINISCNHTKVTTTTPTTNRKNNKNEKYIKGGVLDKLEVEKR